MGPDKFDYSAPAELYTVKRMWRGRPSMSFHRFDTAACAIRYSIEELPRASLPGSLLEVGEQRYQHADIRELYESSDYPLQRERGTGKRNNAEKAEL